MSFYSSKTNNLKLTVNSSKGMKKVKSIHNPQAQSEFQIDFTQLS